MPVGQLPLKLCTSVYIYKLLCEWYIIVVFDMIIVRDGARFKNKLMRVMVYF
jgi:hypothetical protein